MKAFRFRLDSALRWRSTQLQLAQEGVARAAAHLSAIETDISTVQALLNSGARELTTADSGAFAAWGAYSERCTRRISLLRNQLSEARAALAAQTQALLEAHRKVRVLTNLHSAARAEWTSELNRETDAFAGEVFLARLQSKSGRARSSVG